MNPENSYVSTPVLSAAACGAGTRCVTTDTVVIRAMTCELAGLTPITTVEDCETVILEINLANNYNVYRGDPAPVLSSTSYSWRPSGCYTSCFNEQSGHFCPGFNDANTEHEAQVLNGDSGAIFCLGGATRTECTACSPGQYEATGAGGCMGCVAGTEPNADATGCVGCRTGKTSAEGEVCGLCPTGKYAAGPGSSECTRCDAGHVANTAHTSCEACLAGKFAEPGDQPVYADHCVTCGVGRSAPHDRATECALCPVDVPAPTYQTVSAEGDTCASSGLYPITTALECRATIIAQNDAGGRNGHDGSVPTIQSSSSRPTGC
eukprot:SAG22_NODE_94_length_20824_cov_230.693718_9_plen_321_part_00